MQVLLCCHLLYLLTSYIYTARMGPRTIGCDVIDEVIIHINKIKSSLNRWRNVSKLSMNII